MARIRTVKPEFWTDEKLSKLPESVHMLAAALLNYADDEGYFNANPALVKAACFPLREPSVSVHGGLTQLCDLDYIRIANGIDGRSYGWVVGFAKHQRVNRPTPSRIKGLVDSWERSVSTHGGLTEDSLLEQGTGNREVEQGKGSGGGEVRKRPTPQPTEVDPRTCKYPVFPTTPGKDCKAVMWVLEDALVEELSATFPAVDVPFQARKAHGWVMANLNRRKTYDGMHKFLFSWMAQEQDKGGKVTSSRQVDPRGNFAATQRYLEKMGAGDGEE